MDLSNFPPIDYKHVQTARKSCEAGIDPNKQVILISTPKKMF